MDGVQKAKSGHPGMPMGAAPTAYALWTDHLRHDPAHPRLPNRDRFILSGGHGSMLLYSLLFLTGYGLTLDDLKNFRQLHSKTPGHPEYGLTPGVEMTTGPLGQGFATGIGMAIAQKYLAARYNRPGHPILDYMVYGMAGDGDMMEGISSEAASLAGHLKLGNVVYLYDDNQISIDGNTSLAFTEDVSKRFEAYGWHVQVVEDGNDICVISDAIAAARHETGRPSLIRVRTHIGYGSPNKQDTAEAHGSPLGEEEIKLTKKNLGLDPEQSFEVPEDVLTHMRRAQDRGAQLQKQWEDQLEAYRREYPAEAAELERLLAGDLGTEWVRSLPSFTEAMATREASGKVLNAIAPHLPMLIGGSADLTPSNNTLWKGVEDFQASRPAGRYLRFGVREHAMGAILNGLALTNGLIPYGGTFLIFSDYMRPTIRLAALMGIRPIYVFTHDSIGLGEDGPTHQPIEQLAALRAIPNITVIRPADATEVPVAWEIALRHTSGPVALVLARQKVPVIDRTKYAAAANVQRGAYILADATADPRLILIASGSEVALVLAAYERLAGEGIAARVVSMPSWELFERQRAEYKETVFPPSIRRRLVVEAGVPMGWERYAGDQGVVIGMTTFGTSAPADAAFKAFGFTVDAVVHRAKSLIA
jgi:transketolase